MSEPGVTGYQSFKRDTEHIQQRLKSESFTITGGVEADFWESLYRLEHHANKDAALLTTFGMLGAWTWHRNPVEVETVGRPHLTFMGPGRVYLGGDGDEQG